MVTGIERRHLKDFCDKHSIDYVQIDDSLDYYENLRQLENQVRYGDDPERGPGIHDSMSVDFMKDLESSTPSRKVIREAKSMQLDYLTQMARGLGHEIISSKELRRLEKLDLQIVAPDILRPKRTRRARVPGGSPKKRTRKRRGLPGLGLRSVKINLPKMKDIVGPLMKMPSLTGAKARKPRKSSTKKRQKSHTERAGKVPRHLKKAIKNGARHFSFTDDVWKTSKPRKIRKRKRKKRRKR